MRYLAILAVLLVQDPDPGTRTVEDARDSITGTEIGGHVAFLASDEMAGRDTPSEGLRKAAEYVCERFKEAGLKPLGDDGSYIASWKYGPDETPVPNCIGLLEGADKELKNQYIYVGAHMDHIGRRGESVFNGADDNASGTAGVLELAEAFASLRERPKRSIVFVTFSGGEKGFLGSKACLDDPKVPLKQTVAMINLHMIGRSKDDYLFVGGVGTSPAWPGLVTETGKRHGFAPETGPGGSGPSDGRSFYDRGVPVLDFSTNVHADYHRPTDDPDAIDSDAEARILKMVFDIVHEVAGAGTRPEFTRNEGRAVPRDFYARLAGGPPPPGRARVRLGVNVDDTGDGPMLTNVQKGSPADKAGLKKGDIIRKMGGKAVNSLNDLRTRLAKFKPGDKTTVTYSRRGKETKVEVEFPDQ